MNIVKSITLTVAMGISTVTLLQAQDNKPADAPVVFKNGDKIIPKNIASGILSKDDGTFKRAVVLGYKDKQLYFKNDINDLKTQKLPLVNFSGVFMFDPPAFKAAKNAFRDRKYKEALKMFLECQEHFKLFKGLENNFFDLSVYYTLECYRKLHDYANLQKVSELFISDNLTRPSHQAQIEVYKIWSAVNSKNWERLEALCDDWTERKVPIGVRAQIAFCQGLAYEGQGKFTEALNAYGMAMTADFTKSDSIVREAALNSLRIFDADEEVRTAIKVWKTKFEEKDVAGYRKLGEANALAALYDKAGLGSGVELPAELKKFQKYTSDERLEQIQQQKDQLEAREEAEAKAAAGGGKVKKGKKGK